MNLLRNILLVIITVSAFVTTSAQVATWSIHPKYEKLVRYYGDIYAFLQNNKWGLVQSGDKELIPANYDFITPFINGYALVGIKDGNRYMLKGIVDETGDVSELSDKFYLPSSNQYVSEGKLVVVNSINKYGYINTDGDIVIKCQFDKALPFKEGWASVKQGNYYKYISETYDKNPSHSILPVDFHYGELTMSSCFSAGTAVVAYNKEFALINNRGQMIKELGEADFKQLYKNNNAPSNSSNKGFSEITKYCVVVEDGKSGLKDGETVVIQPQFDTFFSQYNDETVLTMLNGKYGLLKIADGRISITTNVKGQNSNELEVDRKGQLTPVTVDCAIPSCIQDPSLLVDLGDGKYRDFTSQLIDIEFGKSLSITPVIEKNAESCSIKAILEYDGIVLSDIKKTFNVTYPIILRLSSPGPSIIRADENDNATFSSTIFNDSNKQTTVTATWSTGKIVTITIPAKGRRTISESVSVTRNYVKDIGISLSTGERAHSTIKFQTFF